MKQKALITFCLLIPIFLSANEIIKTTNKETQLSAWTLSKGNFQLELIQRSPEQTRSFFQGRGFSPKVADEIANSCVFQTIGRNSEADNSSDSVSISLKQWRIMVVTDNTIVNEKEKNQQALKLKEEWDKQWKDSDVKASSRIAFRWATYPTEQTFDPGGDFNWGMISIGPKPDTIFDLHVFWQQGNQQHDAWIKQMQCPTDQTSQ